MTGISKAISAETCNFDSITMGSQRCKAAAPVTSM
jgi:hypothetical protein